MPTKRKNFDDPATAANLRILKAREEAIIQREVENTLDLGLKIAQPEPESAAEFMRDEWDKKAYGDAPQITTRIVYGPDPLVDACPEFHDRLEKLGQEEVAEAFYTLIMRKGALAAPDPIMRKGLMKSIHKFGKEKTAAAFRDRVMAIPSRMVEIEIGGELDPLLVNPMRALVAEYCTPGMSPKFLSDRCMTVLGKRGYEIVKDKNGDPVKCGTLIMGIVPTHVAERRRLHFAEEARNAVRSQEELYIEAADRIGREEGGGAAALRRGDKLENMAGDSRGSGVYIENLDAAA